MIKFKICILKARLGGDLAGLMSTRIRAIDLAIARSIHQGLGLRFPCNDLTLN